MVVIDQITKFFAVKYLIDGPVTVIPKILDFTYVENDGIAWGLLDGPNQRWIFMTLSSIAIIGMIVYMIGWKPKSKFACAALALILGGGIGNMIDRFFYVGVIGDTAGKKVVVDFIDVNAFGDLWTPVFNFADSCVCVGGAMLFVWCLGSLIKETIEEKRAKSLAAAVEQAIGEHTEADAKASENTDAAAEQTDEQCEKDAQEENK